MLDKIHTCHNNNKNMVMTLQKVKAHAGIPANEAADELAKEAMVAAKFYPHHASFASFQTLKAPLKQRICSDWRHCRTIFS